MSELKPRPVLTSAQSWDERFGAEEFIYGERPNAAVAAWAGSL